MKSLIIGGGQLGQSLHRSLGAQAAVARGVPWSDPASAMPYVNHLISEFLRDVGDERWLICWSAGAGVVGTKESALSAERAVLQAMLGAVSGSPHFCATRGALFVASSAGGIYASGSGEQQSEDSRPQPTSDYGRSKVIQDDLVLRWAGQHNVRTLIGRISNLYGPRQDLEKPQGFISHLCRAMSRGQCFTLRVPISTIRDFIFTDDVAERVAYWANSLELGSGGPVIKILAAGRSVTLGHVIAITRRVSRSPARVQLTSTLTNGEQPSILRFKSVVLTELETARPPRSLEEGIALTWAGAFRRMHEVR